MPYSAEPIPPEIIHTMLDAQWQTYTGSIPEPTWVVVNSGTQAPRVDLVPGDAVVIRLGIPGETETLRDFWAYLDRTNLVELELHTQVSRQRLYDLKQEIRRIIHSQMHSLTDYQVVRYRDFQEITQEQLNVWQGRITISLENNRLSTET